MKKRKLKYKNIFMLLGFVVLIVFVIKIVLKKDFIVEFNFSNLNYNEELAKNMIKKITYKGNNIKDEVTYQYDSSKIGKSKVVFKYKEKEFVEYINIVDLEKPSIELLANEIVLINGDEYKETGYKASDNYDGDLTSKVEITNNIDNEIDGEYEVIYKVKDSSNNETIAKRKVIVTSDSPIEMTVEDFTLSGYYTNAVLNETNMADDSILEEIVFAGDSIPLYYGTYSAIKGSQIWNKNGITPETAKTVNININYGNNGEMLLVDAYKKYKPSITVITLGSNSTAWMNKDYFISEYKSLIKSIQEVSPNTKIIIQSLPPVSLKLDNDGNALNNKKINTYNYYILKMCNEMDISFLNSAIALKDENGTCKDEYCQKDGIHQTKEGIKEMVLYLKSHLSID